MGLLPTKMFLDDFFDDFEPVFFKGMPKMDTFKCDIYEKDGNINIEMDTPGYNKEDIKIDVDDGVLTIEATKENKVEEKDKKYVRRERHYGSIKRQFTIGDINEKNIKAKFDNGVLKISFKKEEEKEKSKKFIEIK